MALRYKPLKLCANHSNNTFSKLLSINISYQNLWIYSSERLLYEKGFTVVNYSGTLFLSFCARGGNHMYYLQDHQTFTSKTELNEAVANHLSHNNSKLNETDREVFLFISRYSVKYYGASHLKVATIANNLNKSTRTVQRSIKKMEGLHMIKKLPFIRSVSGGYGANLYQILPYDVTSSCHIDNNRQTSTISVVDESKTKNEPISFNNKQEQSLHDTSLTDSVPTLYERFKSLLANTLGQTNKLASRLYGIYRAKSISYMRFDYLKGEQQLFEDLAVQALHIATQATKKKKIKNLAGYYNGVFQNLIENALFGEHFYEELDELVTH